MDIEQLKTEAAVRQQALREAAADARPSGTGSALEAMLALISAEVSVRAREAAAPARDPSPPSGDANGL